MIKIEMKLPAPESIGVISYTNSNPNTLIALKRYCIDNISSSYLFDSSPKSNPNVVVDNDDDKVFDVSNVLINFFTISSIDFVLCLMCSNRISEAANTMGYYYCICNDIINDIDNGMLPDN